MKLNRYTIPVLVALVTVGCTFTPKELTLEAKPTLTNSNVAEGTVIHFSFIDDRDDVAIGVRGTGNMGSKITAQNLAEYVERELRTGLVEKGYRLVDVGSDDVPSITYRLRAFKFSLNMGFWTGAENKTAIIRADANRNGKTFAETYRFDDEDRDVFVPGGKELNRELNEALAAVMSDALNDRTMDAFLMGTYDGQ